MCCLFGLIDYGHALTGREKTKLVRALAVEAEARGTDAAGIAYNSGGRLRVYKRPWPARFLRFKVPNDAYAVMGHTRLTTQGNERFNYNNHPFPAHVPGADFALAHNGILYNDDTLRKQHKLPDTRIQTDSYVAVQLLEHRQELTIDSLAWMVEQLTGSYCFSVLDGKNNLYLVKGDNPLCLVHYPRLGLYLYASTKEILFRALDRRPPCAEAPVEVTLDAGDILKIDTLGGATMGRFDPSNLYQRWGCYSDWDYYPRWPLRTKPTFPVPDPSYLEDLKAVAASCGWDPTNIDRLLAQGFTCEEIEEYLYESPGEGCLCEL